MTRTERVDVLGVEISAIDMDRALEEIIGWIARAERRYVCVTNVHLVMESQDDPRLRRILNDAGLTTPDGMPLVWLLRLRGHRAVRRVYGPDLLLALCQRSPALGYRHFLCGGAPGVADRLAARLCALFPGLIIVGTHSPPFAEQAGEPDPDVVRLVEAARPDVVWVGLGAPKQEHWMGVHRPVLSAPVLIGVGAAFDFVSGMKAQAPRWMRQTGLEWLFRLGQEPGRLFSRYARTNPRFLLLLALELAGLRGPPRP